MKRKDSEYKGGVGHIRLAGIFDIEGEQTTAMHFFARKLFSSTEHTTYIEGRNCITHALKDGGRCCVVGNSKLEGRKQTYMPFICEES